MYEWFDILRISLSFFFLALSSWYDLKMREVPNWVWVFFAPLGLVFSSLYFFFTWDNSFLTFLLLSFLVTTGISLVLFYLGFFGGADAKALICLSIVLPVYPSSLIPYLGIRVAMPLFTLSILSNAILGSSMTIFAIMGYNLFILIRTKENLFEGLGEESLWNKILAFITGFKIDLDKLGDGSHYIPLEIISRGEDGKVVRRLDISFRPDEETSQKIIQLKNFSGEIKGKIWVTPGLPFLVFVAIGFVVALFIGDIIFWLATRLIGL